MMRPPCRPRRAATSIAEMLAMRRTNTPSSLASLMIPARPRLVPRSPGPGPGPGPTCCLAVTRPFCSTVVPRSGLDSTPASPSSPKAGAGPGSATDQRAGRAHFGPGLVGAVGSLHSKTGLVLRCTIFDQNGTARIVSGTFDKSVLCAENGLEMRDLRKIDSRVPNVVPTILARRGAFLVNMLHIRALVKHDTVLLFDGYGASNSQLHSAFVYNLEHNLRLASVHRLHRPDDSKTHAAPITDEAGDNLPYEFRALESILASVLEALHIELEGIRQLVFALLASLDQNIDREKLRALLAYRRKVGDLLSRSRGVKMAVAEVLESDEDMALMHLTDAANGHPRTVQSLAWSYDSLELLLESFDKQLEEVISYTDQMQDNIGGTQEIVELILDSNRNQLLALELHVSIATLGFTGGALIASFFGMNLHTGLEENPIAFSVVCVSALMVVASFSAAGIRKISNIQRVGLGRARRSPLLLPVMRLQGSNASPWPQAAQGSTQAQVPSPAAAEAIGPTHAHVGSQARGEWWHRLHSRLPTGRNPPTPAPPSPAHHAPASASSTAPSSPSVTSTGTQDVTTDPEVAVQAGAPIAPSPGEPTASHVSTASPSPPSSASPTTSSTPSDPAQPYTYNHAPSVPGKPKSWWRQILFGPDPPEELEGQGVAWAATYAPGPFARQDAMFPEYSADLIGAGYSSNRWGRSKASKRAVANERQQLEKSERYDKH